MKRVLILEDDKWFAESLAQILADSCEVVVCHSPEEVFGILEGGRPDLLLVDLALGSKNALVLLHEMQSHVDTRNIPIIILSANASAVNTDDLRSFGVVRVLGKGAVTPRTLRQELANV